MKKALLAAVAILPISGICAAEAMIITRIRPVNDLKKLVRPSSDKRVGLHQRLRDRRKVMGVTIGKATPGGGRKIDFGIGAALRSKVAKRRKGKKAGGRRIARRRGKKVKARRKFKRREAAKIKPRHARRRRAKQ